MEIQTSSIDWNNREQVKQYNRNYYLTKQSKTGQPIYSMNKRKDPNYFKNWYEDHKDDEVQCEHCCKTIKKYNWSKHTKTSHHLLNVSEYNQLLNVTE